MTPKSSSPRTRSPSVCWLPTFTMHAPSCDAWPTRCPRARPGTAAGPVSATMRQARRLVSREVCHVFGGSRQMWAASVLPGCHRPASARSGRAGWSARREAVILCRDAMVGGSVTCTCEGALRGGQVEGAQLDLRLRSRSLIDDDDARARSRSRSSWTVRRALGRVGPESGFEVPPQPRWSCDSPHEIAVKEKTSRPASRGRRCVFRRSLWRTAVRAGPRSPWAARGRIGGRPSCRRRCRSRGCDRRT